MLDATIPFGHICTYRELAKGSGNSLASRAVAHALAQNPLPLLIPCHRVVGSNGNLTGYQGGTSLKRRLLTGGYSISSSPWNSSAPNCGFSLWPTQKMKPFDARIPGMGYHTNDER